MRREPPTVIWLRQLALAAGVLAGLLLAASQSQGQAPARTSAFWVASAPAGPRIWLVLSAEADSALTTGLDTATVERGWCVAAHVDYAARVVTITRAWVPRGTRSYADSVVLPCADGVPLAHLHMRDHGHLEGPSPQDYAGLGAYRAFGLVIVRQMDPRYLRFIVFGLGPGCQ